MNGQTFSDIESEAWVSKGAEQNITEGRQNNKTGKKILIVVIIDVRQKTVPRAEMGMNRAERIPEVHYSAVQRNYIKCILREFHELIEQKVQLKILKSGHISTSRCGRCK